MSRQPFAHRYWSTLTGDSIAGDPPTASRTRTGRTFWPRYWASLTMTGSPVTKQDLVETNWTRLRQPADVLDPDGPPPTDGIDLLDSGMRPKRPPSADPWHLRVLVPVAAALAVMGIVLGLGLASSQLSEHLVATAQQTNPGGAGINDIAFSPNGGILATGDSDGGVKLWNVTSSTLTLSKAVPPIAGGHVTSVAFSPDGKILAIADSDGTVRRWDPSTGRLIGAPLNAQAGAANSVAFSPDGKILAVGYSDGIIQLWNTTTGQPVGPLSQPAGAVKTVAFSPDGKLLAAGYSDGLVRLWDTATHQPLLNGTAIASGAVNTVAFSPDGELLAVGDSGGSITLRSVPSANVLARHSVGAAVNGIAFSPDGRTIAAGDSAGSIFLLDEQGKVLSTTHSDGGQSVSSVEFRTGTATIATATSAGAIQLYSVSDTPGYAVVWADRQFTMPGGGCSQSYPSSVTFDVSNGLIVYSPGSSAIGDLYLDCAGSTPGINFDGNPAARVSGTVSASACDQAVNIEPMSGDDIPLSQLSPGEQFCLVKGQISELVLLTLRQIDRNNEDLTWSATAWKL